jgi:hypothetical protein
VYFFLGDDEELIYAGKAKNIRARLRQHARARATSAARMRLLYDTTREVRWETLQNEDAALVREADVIVALQPRFNASITLDGRWPYLALTGTDASTRFELTGARPEQARRVYGCFPHLGVGVSSRPGIACSEGYVALLRLLWAASDAPGIYPRRIAGGSPPERFDAPVPGDLVAALHAFLSGTSVVLLSSLRERVRARNAFMQAGLDRDAASAGALFAHGPRALRALRLRHAVAARPMSRETIRTLLIDELHASIGDFRPPDEPDERDRSLHRNAHRWARRC